MCKYTHTKIYDIHITHMRYKHTHTYIYIYMYIYIVAARLLCPNFYYDIVAMVI